MDWKTGLKNNEVVKNVPSSFNLSNSSSLPNRQAIRSRVSPTLKAENEKELKIKSNIEFDKNESNTDSDVLINSPFEQSKISSSSFPRYKTQNEVSSSSEHVSFEGSKMSRSRRGSKNGKIQPPEIETWENANGDASFKKSKEKLDLETDQLSPCSLKGSSSLFNQLKMSPQRNNLQQNKHFSNNSDSITEINLNKALNTLDLRSDVVQILGKDFGKNLCLALKQILQSKENDSNYNHLPEFKNQLHSNGEWVDNNSITKKRPLSKCNQSTSFQKQSFKNNQSKSNSFIEKGQKEFFDSSTILKLNEDCHDVSSVKNLTGKSVHGQDQCKSATTKSLNWGGMMKPECKDVSIQTLHVETSCKPLFTQTIAVENVSTQTDRFELIESKKLCESRNNEARNIKIFDPITIPVKSSEAKHSTDDFKANKNTAGIDQQVSQQFFDDRLEEKIFVNQRNHKSRETPRLWRSISTPTNRSKFDAFFRPNFYKHICNKVSTDSRETCGAISLLTHNFPDDFSKASSISNRINTITTPDNFKKKTSKNTENNDSQDPLQLDQDYVFASTIEEKINDSENQSNAIFQSSKNVTRKKPSKSYKNSKLRRNNCFQIPKSSGLFEEKIEGRNYLQHNGLHSAQQNKTDFLSNFQTSDEKCKINNFSSHLNPSINKTGLSPDSFSNEEQCLAVGSNTKKNLTSKVNQLLPSSSNLTTSPMKYSSEIKVKSIGNRWNSAPNMGLVSKVASFSLEKDSAASCCDNSKDKNLTTASDPAIEQKNVIETVDFVYILRPNKKSAEN